MIKHLHRGTPDTAQEPYAGLLSQSTMTLATSGERGIHAAPLFFVSDTQFFLYYFSEERSRHSQDIAQNPHAAAAIYPQYQGWQEIRGLQIHGQVRRIIPSEEWDSAWKKYQQKFPFVKSLRLVITRNHLYCLAPDWIRLVDNNQSFGYKEEWDLVNHDS